jgi:tetraacyldisaccharide 4'-kinase
MRRILKLLLLPFSFLYWCITRFRNALFDAKIKRSLSFSLPIINVGNLSMGGTGKTPHVEYLIRLLKPSYPLATLSRGYGRKVYGFQIADTSASAYKIGDEPYLFYRKYGQDITVAVDADRVNGVSEICLQKPNVEVVLLDDAFQHRHIQPGLNILLTDYRKPFYRDYVLPYGTLRESKTGAKRADIIIITKCPADLPQDKKEQIRQKVQLKNPQKLFFSHVEYGKINPLTKFNTSLLKTKSIVLVTGIAYAEPLHKHLAKTYHIIKHFNFPDHYSFKEKDMVDIQNILTKFAGDNPVVVTTEKDAMRLLDNSLQRMIENQPWYYQEIAIVLDNQQTFNQLIEDYVQKNSRDY